MTPEEFKQLAGMLELVLQQPPEDRDACVLAMTEGNDEMRREMRALVAAHRTNDTFLESPVVEEIEDPLRPGQSVIHYTIEKEIGRGGMGVVYLARDTRLNRHVALKALSPHLVFDSRQRERLRREAGAAASVSHPAVATVYALEEVDGDVYIISEYVPGETFASRAGRTRMEAAEALRVGAQVADGLAAAHDQGLVHRDLKPHNVICTPSGQPKIIDFSVARVAGSDRMEQRLTQTGQLLGSPAYMSPEQLQGDPVDFRSDIFSFGIFLYELLSGSHPFEARTPAGTVAAILNSEPPPLEGIDSRTESVIRRCLAKDPRDRFASARQLVEELQRPAMGPAPDRHARPEANNELHSQWWTFHQAAVVLLYAVMVGVVWDIKEDGGGGLLAAFFGILATAIANATLRVHLLFTSRFNPRSLGFQMNRVHKWVRAIDWGFASLLLATAAAIAFDQQLIAGVVAAVAVAYLVVFLVVEPATVSAVFRYRPPRGD